MKLGGLYANFVSMLLMFFINNSGTYAQTRHIKAKYLQNQPRQIQFFILGGTLRTFSYNRQRD